MICSIDDYRVSEVSQLDDTLAAADRVLEKIFWIRLICLRKSFQKFWRGWFAEPIKVVFLI